VEDDFISNIGGVERFLSNFGDFFVAFKRVDLSVSGDTFGKSNSRHSSESTYIEYVLGFVHHG